MENMEHPKPLSTEELLSSDLNEATAPLPESLQSTWRRRFERCADNFERRNVLARAKAEAQMRSPGEVDKHYKNSAISDTTLGQSSQVRESFESSIPQGAIKLGIGAVGYVYTDPASPKSCLKIIYDNREYDSQIRLGVGTTLREEYFLLKQAYELTKDMKIRAVEPHEFYEKQNSEGSITMEMVNGKSLAQILEKPSCFARSADLLKIDVQSLTQDFLAAFDALHKGGLFHKDVASRNFMVDNNLQFYIIDFGRAKRASEKNINQEEKDRLSALENIDVKETINDFISQLVACLPKA